MSELSPLTSTSDMRAGIQQVSSGNFNAVAQMFRKKRSDSFALGHADKYTGTEKANPFVPMFTKDPAGEEIARQATGVGEFVMDPMQHLEEKVNVDHPYAHIPIGNASDTTTESLRRKGLSAYKRVNSKSPSKNVQGGYKY